MNRRANAQSGFTLVELMVSLVLFSFAVAGVLSVAVTLTQGYREQRQAMAAENSVRVPIDFIADAIRQTSPGVQVPSKMQDAVTCSTSGGIAVTNDAGGNGPDELELIYASGAVVTSSRTAFPPGSGMSIELNDASQFAVDDFLVITNLTDGNLLKVTAVNGNIVDVQTPCGGATIPSAGYGIGSIVVRAHHARFFIDTLDGAPALWMDPDGDRITTPNDREPLAEGIEDMQIAVGVDVNNDGAIAELGAAAGDDEWSFNYPGEAAPALTANIRAVRVTLIARASKALLGSPLIFSRPAAEDRTTAGAADAFRRRVLRTTVDMRNIGGSP